MAAVGLIPTGQCSVPAPVRVTGRAAAAGRHLVEDFPGLDVPFVVDERPGAIEGGRPEIVRAPPHNVAGAMAHGAVDALDACVHRAPRIGGGVDRGHRFASGHCAFEAPARAPPLVEERRRIAHEILDARQVAQRFDDEPAGAGNVLHVAPARPPRPSVHRHCARPAHAHAAREPVRQRGFEMPLDPGDDVEHRLVLRRRHLVGDELAGVAAAPDPYVEHRG